MRLFIAIPLPDALRASLARFQSRLAETRAHVRWVDPAHYHLTVKFLGETDPSFLAEISARLTRVAEQVPAFPLELDGLGRFPERGPARVIIVHVHSPDQRLTKLHRLIDSAVGGLGLPLDTRALDPHLTLGRVESGARLNRLLRLVDKHAADLLGSFDVNQVTLFQSQPGSVYTPLHTATLTPAKPESHPPSVAIPSASERD